MPLTDVSAIRPRSIGLIVGLGLSAFTLGFASMSSPSVGSRGDVVSEPRLVATDDRFPNATAEDWVSYADHVVLASATADSAERVVDSEVARGDGGLIGRDVSLRIDDVLWSRSAARELPRSLRWKGYGWVFDGNDPKSRVEIAEEGVPRVEVGHRYVVAVRWESSPCPDPSDVAVEGWVGLGSSGIIPADSEILGHGESAGRVVRSAAMKHTLVAAGPRPTFEESVIGLPVSRVIDELATVSSTRAPALTQAEVKSWCDG